MVAVVPLKGPVVEILRPSCGNVRVRRQRRQQQQQPPQEAAVSMSLSAARQLASSSSSLIGSQRQQLQWRSGAQAAGSSRCCPVPSAFMEREQRDGGQTAAPATAPAAAPALSVVDARGSWAAPPATSASSPASTPLSPSSPFTPSTSALPAAPSSTATATTTKDGHEHQQGEEDAKFHRLHYHGHLNKGTVKGKGGGGSGSGGSSGSAGGDRSGASSVSSGVRLEGIKKTFKGVELLKDINWEVKKGERVGLVGVNGAGKTTQLKIISGELEPDAGVVLKAKPNMRISFLTQEFEVVPSRTVREEFLSAFAEQMEVKDRLEHVQAALERATDDMELMGKLLDELDELQRKAESVDLYDVDVKINKMLPELGFELEDCDRLVASYSGGWQMRMSLGKILLQEPDLLLLDEPTNHLDLDAIEWLEKYLKRLDVPMVIVSHDRAFLDQLCTKIVETDMGVSRSYAGNYSAYVAAHAEWVESQRLAWERQQREIARTEDMIQRLSGGGNSGRASSAEKKLEKMQEEGSAVEKPFERKAMRFRFPEVERSGRIVVQIAGLGHGYDDKVLFEKAKLQITRGEKLAFIGPNGAGKSTLLRFIMGFEEPQHGSVLLGEHRVIANYFEQNQAEALDLEKTVLQTVEEAAEGWRMNDIKALLGRFNFKGDTVHRKVSFLSGGEKARLALCKFMVTPATLLVLDEPTNHLDIPTKEMLEEALREFTGTVIAVSHDRYFLRQIVNRVVEVKDQKLQDYSGDYNYYLEQNLEARRRELERENEVESAATAAPKAKSKMSKAEKELQKKQKAQAFSQKQAKGKVAKNAKRWG